MKIEELTYTALADRYCAKQKCETAELFDRLSMICRDYQPDGLMLLECHQLDSSFMGSLAILPYGQKCTFKATPEYPISPRGLASDMSIVVATVSKQELIAAGFSYE